MLLLMLDRMMMEWRRKFIVEITKSYIENITCNVTPKIDIIKSYVLCPAFRLLLLLLTAAAQDSG